MRSHPLSALAREELREIERAPKPRSELNPGVAARLERDSLVEHASLLSPYKTTRGMVLHLRITDAGRCALSTPSAQKPARLGRLQMRALVRAAELGGVMTSRSAGTDVITSDTVQSIERRGWATALWRSSGGWFTFTLTTSGAAIAAAATQPAESA